ncbi:hypothetical protein PAHAL_5G410900 [Panicum hallii]|uniref:Uncharacterized protein n=1 Tax=Panicum hallii TaxID=206008 RepID=A0A2T8IMU7_9POAL|nr:hypothetical protein PAHAL_5G410900 [Panicum hallii]
MQGLFGHRVRTLFLFFSRLRSAPVLDPDTCIGFHFKIRSELSSSFRLLFSSVLPLPALDLANPTRHRPAPPLPAAGGDSPSCRSGHPLYPARNPSSSSAQPTGDPPPRTAAPSTPRDHHHCLSGRCRRPPLLIPSALISPRSPSPNLTPNSNHVLRSSLWASGARSPYKNFASHNRLTTPAPTHISK